MAAFKGPVFVVGVPRSGTKLLRDLLNRNPRISIPEIETHFIPYFIRKYGKPAPLADARLFEEFCDELVGTTFYKHMQELGFSLDRRKFAAAADLADWSSIFEYLLRAFSNRAGESDFIFGDKTPDYLKAIEFLRGVFPDGRFIHIIRDPRDCCLSAWRVWGQHPYRTAHRWQESLEMKRGVGKGMGGYMEVKYEELLSDPQPVLEAVCRFLDCDFTSNMLTLQKPSENLGATKGRRHIVSSNTNKFWTGFSRRRIRRIEEIAFRQMESLGYPIFLAEGPRGLDPVSSFLLRGHDLLTWMRFNIHRRGLLEGARYQIAQRSKRVRL